MERVNKKLEDGFTKVIFDHIRNVLICTFLLAIGTSQLKEPDEMFFSLTQGKNAGVGIIAISFILFVINTYDGVRAIHKTKFHSVISVLLIFLYLFFSIKLMEMGWDFRIVSS